MFILAVFCVTLLVVEGKVTVTKFEDCDPNGNYKIKTLSKIKEENGKQMLEESSLFTQVDLGDNIMNELDIQIFKDDKYVPLTKVKDTYCNILKNYIGDFGTSLMTVAGVKSCPIPKGDYKVTNHPLDFSIFKYKDFPDGKLKILIKMMDAKSNEQLGCTDLEFTIQK